jgi:hypothetical protein
VFPGLASIPLAHVGGPDTPVAVITPEPSTAEDLRRCWRSESAWRLTSRHARLRAPAPVWISVGLQAQPVRLAWRRYPWPMSVIRIRLPQSSRSSHRLLRTSAGVGGPSAIEEISRCRRSESAWRLTSRHGRLRAPASVWMSAGLQARPVRLPIARCGVGVRSSRRTARESARWMSEW